MAELCKYYKKQKYVSYNEGQTWQPLDEYEMGELVETNSSSCGEGVFMYRWFRNENALLSDGRNKYTREDRHYSEDGVYWYGVNPGTYRKGTLVERNSSFCDNAGTGGYATGTTEPIDPNEHGCPVGYFYDSELDMCVCKGVMEGDKCVSCGEDQHYDYNERICVCDNINYRASGRYCIYIDPYQQVKCGDTKIPGILSKDDITYMADNGITITYVVLYYTIGYCINAVANNTFNGQVYMTSLTVESSDNNLILGETAFGNCNALTTLEFPRPVILSRYTFMNCSDLVDIDFQKGLVSDTIPAGAFMGCVSLKSAFWLSSNNITSIGISAFANCYALSNVTLGGGLVTINDFSFKNNIRLETIIIPQSVTRIGQEAFGGCTSLKNVMVESETLTLGSGAFRNCDSLTAVTFNSSSVTFPVVTEENGNTNVFKYTNNIVKLVFTSNTPFEIPAGAFDGINDYFSIYVPCGSVDAYKQAWSEYADRIKCGDTGLYYRWVDAEGTYCDGTDEWRRQKEQSTSNGVWTDTGAYRNTELITHYSPTCGYIGDVALTLTDQDGIKRYYEPCQ